MDRYAFERLGARRGISGIGTRGPGDSQIETDRPPRARPHRLAPAPARPRARHPRRPARRARRAHLPTVALTGYAIAGECDAAERPHRRGPSASATGSSTRSTRPPARCADDRTFLVTDTVGSVRRAAPSAGRRLRRDASRSAGRPDPAHRRHRRAGGGAGADDARGSRTCSRSSAPSGPRDCSCSTRPTSRRNERARELSLPPPTPAHFSAPLTAARAWTRSASRSPRTSTLRCRTSSSWCLSPGAATLCNRGIRRRPQRAPTPPTACASASALPAVVAERFNGCTASGDGTRQLCPAGGQGRRGWRAPLPGPLARATAVYAGAGRAWAALGSAARRARSPRRSMSTTTAASWPRCGARRWPGKLGDVLGYVARLAAPASKGLDTVAAGDLGQSSQVGARPRGAQQQRRPR